MRVMRSIFLLLSLFGWYVLADISYCCHFENGFCSFLMNDKHNTVNWTKGRGISKSGSAGPRIDHTLGKEYGNYIFVSVSSAKGKQVKLQTIALSRDYCVRFFYHMIGEDIGDFEVYRQSLDNQEDVKQYFYREKSQGFHWKEAAFYVANDSRIQKKSYRVIFSINRSSPKNSSGHIALDDIEFTPGKCPDNQDKRGNICNFDFNDCGYRSMYRGNWKWQGGVNHTLDSSVKPVTDHTLGTASGGYWFAETSNIIGLENFNHVYSPEFKASNKSTGCLQFYYYIGTSNRVTQVDSEGKVYKVFIYAAIQPTKGDLTHSILKYLSNTIDKQWTFVEEEVPLSTTFQIRFSAYFNTTIPVVIALDDVQLLPGSCPKADPCLPNPCLNNGLCQVSAGNMSISCKCPQGYKGEFCEIDLCSPNPCLNKGSCQVSAENTTISCKCAQGYKGEFCEIDLCSPNPCLNKGSCHVSAENSTISCKCARGYKGEFCETKRIFVQLLIDA